MKSKSLILMIVAMACGLVAAYTTARLTAKSNDETEKVFVANTEIKIGTVLKEPEKLFVEVDYRKGTAPNSVSDLEKLKDKVVTRTVRPGQFVVPEDLSTNFGITPPKGTKAMAIKVTADTAVAGFIMPGSRVDVMATVGDANVGKPPEVQTVLQNQEVLAVDRISVRPDGQSAVETISTVTLAVTPQNAQKLELAMKLSNGHVRLLLRDQNDTAVNRINPRKNLNEDLLDFTGDGANGIRALAAKDDMPAGTVIDDPSKFFQPVGVAAMPDKGFLELDLNKLKGKTVRTAVFKDAFVTAKHLDEKTGAEAADANGKAPAVAPPREPETHVLVIHNGGKEPHMAVYQDGKLANSDSGRPMNTAPAPKPPVDRKDEQPKPDNQPDKATGRS